MAKSKSEEIKEVIKLSELKSQREFAEEFDIPLSTLEQWISGTRTPPDYIIPLIEYKVKAEKRKEDVTNKMMLLRDFTEICINLADKFKFETHGDFNRVLRNNRDTVTYATALDNIKNYLDFKAPNSKIIDKVNSLKEKISNSGLKDFRIKARSMNMLTEYEFSIERERLILLHQALTGKDVDGILERRINDKHFKSMFDID